MSGAGREDKTALALKMLSVLVSLLIAAGVVVYEYRDELKKARDASDHFAAMTEVQDTFSPTDQFFAILGDTTCEYIVLCGAKPPPEPVTLSPGDFRNFGFPPAAPAENDAWYLHGPVGEVLLAATIVPKLPHVLYRLLVDRWHDGSIAFLTGLLFVLTYLTILIVAARTHILALIAMVPLGPLVASLLFWILQHIVVLLGLTAGFFIGCLLTIATLPGLLMIVLMRDLREIRDGFMELIRIGRAILR